MGYGLMGAQVDLFIFDALPQALNEDVVAPAAASLHRDARYRCLSAAR